MKKKYCVISCEFSADEEQLAEFFYKDKWTKFSLRSTTTAITSTHENI